MICNCKITVSSNESDGTQLERRDLKDSKLFQYSALFVTYKQNRACCGAQSSKGRLIEAAKVPYLTCAVFACDLDCMYMYLRYK